MLSGHIAATRDRAEGSEGECLIAAQDTTYCNYLGHRQMSGLGVIQGNVRGLMQHNVLLVDELGLPLGLLDQQHWTRQGATDCDKSEGEPKVVPGAGRYQPAGERLKQTLGGHL